MSSTASNNKPLLQTEIPAKMRKQLLLKIREAQRVQDRERVLRKRHLTLDEAVHHYPGPEIMGAMVLIATLALAISLLFPRCDASSHLLSRRGFGFHYHHSAAANMHFAKGNYWKRGCLTLCCITAHVVFTLSIVPVIDLGFRVGYRLQSTRSDSMESMQHIFRHWIVGDVCILVLAIGCTVYAALTCLLCYATRSRCTPLMQ